MSIRTFFDEGLPKPHRLLQLVNICYETEHYYCYLILDPRVAFIRTYAWPFLDNSNIFFTRSWLLTGASACGLWVAR